MRYRGVVAVVVLALVAVGCGSRVNDQPQANANINGPAGGVTSGTTAPGATAANTFGTKPVPCGPNTTGAALTASDKFVTASEIHVSTISDPGGVKPGLDQSVFDTMKAFADWCNGFGGINGRKLVVDFKDAKILQYKDRIAEACEDSFALVGGIAVLDEAGAQDQVNCGLPNVPAAAVSAAVSLGDLTYQPMPNKPTVFGIGPANWVKSQYPDAPANAASIYSNLQIVKQQADRLVEGYETQGYKFVYRQSANINETNWGPLVVGMKNAGVKYFTLTSSFEEVIPLQKEMAAQGWSPEITELETNFYDARYPEQAKAQGADTSNTFVRLTVWPFEEADKNPAMKEYLALLTKAVPDAQPAALGVQSWSAGLLFATAAKDAGADLTRASLEAALGRVTSWDGGGLHAPANPATKTAGGCFVMMKVDDGKFVRAYPLPDKDQAVYDNPTMKGMACPTPASVDLKGDYGTGAKRPSS